MKYIAQGMLIVCLNLLNLVLFGQSKKETIEVLTNRIDSLNAQLNLRDVRMENLSRTGKYTIDSLRMEISILRELAAEHIAVIDSIESSNIRLNEVHSSQLKEIEALRDSIHSLHSKSTAESSPNSDNVLLALKTIKAKWDYFMKDNSYMEYLVKDSIQIIYDEERCIAFLLTEDFLISSYSMKDVLEYDTQIIDLKTNEDLLSTVAEKIHVEDFNEAFKLLNVTNEGYDANGRYFRNGTYHLERRLLVLSEKNY